ncbi:MAG: cytochrome C oxidase subunit IV family protein [Acidobacteriota bacterium]|nr:cytochrome C oxidase subunit IV family protein [Acidobacteriota bacterium]
MEKEPSSTNVSRLVSTSMRPFDRPVVDAGRAGGELPAPGSGGRRAFAPLRRLTADTDLLLNGLCVLFAVGFIALAVRSAAMSGAFISTDSLFMTAVCLMLAGVFMVSPALMLWERGLLKMPSFAIPEGEVLIDEGPIHFEGSMRLFLNVLGGLLVLTVIEVVLAYFQVPLFIMLTILIGLSLIKAALIVAYFMHLRFERMSLVLTLIPILVVCICLLFIFFPDSTRSLNLRTTRAGAVATTEAR